MNKLFVKVICLGIALSFLSISYGQGGRELQTRTITTAAPFLQVAPDARYGGMGEVGVAIADDANAMHYNPAGLPFIEKSNGFSLSYSPWLRNLGIPDINLAYLAGYWKTGENGALGASFRYFSLGTIEFTDFDANSIGSDRPNEFALDLSYGLKVTPKFSAAVALRYFYSRLAGDVSTAPDLKPVNSIAGDIAFLYRTDFTMRSAGADMPVTFSAGVNISNIGPKVSYNASSAATDFIPGQLRLGYAFKFQLDEYNSLTVANDFTKLLVPSPNPDNPSSQETPLLSGIFGSFSDAPGGFSEEITEFNTAIGLEYWYREVFSARLGYFYEDPNKGNRKFITLGAGLKYNVLGINFSYLAPLEQNHPLANTLRLTVTFDFDSGGNE